MRNPLALTLLLTGLASAQAELRIHHSFPLAGSPLSIVVEGARPAQHLRLTLADALDAPPSLQEHVLAHALAWGWFPETPGALTTDWIADELGRLALSVALDEPGDTWSSIALRAETDDGRASAVLRLVVTPPMLVLATGDGLQRVDLRDGTLLQPPIPAAGGMLGLALSGGGETAYLLREGGDLQLFSTLRWEGPPRDILQVEAESSGLAAGAAFVLSRPKGEPFTPAGRLIFIDDLARSVLLEPMGLEVSGRRWAIGPDGLTAWLAEDHMIVREVDLLRREPRGMFTAGLAGDGSISDMLVDGRRLLVTTRGWGGRPGALSVFDIDTGLVRVSPLLIDPRRLIAMEGGGAVLLPVTGDQFQIVEAGGGLRIERAAGALLDAVTAPDGALLLHETAAGVALTRFSPQDGQLAVPGRLPRAGSLASAGGDLVVLYGSSDGRVHSFDTTTGALRLIDGLIAPPGAPSSLLP